MERQLAGLYSKLAKQIAAMIPVLWDMVYYLEEVEKGKQSHSSVFYFHDPQNGKFIQSTSIPKNYQVAKNSYMNQWFQLNKILLEFYDCFAGNGKGLWEQLSFSMDRTGKFNVNYLYDVMNDCDGGQLARKVVWVHKTFGYMPEDGTR